MNNKPNSNSKKQADAIAQLLKKETSYLEISSILQNMSGEEKEEIRKHLGQLASKELLMQYNLEVALEHLAYENHRPEAEGAFKNLLEEIHTELDQENALEAENKGRSNAKILWLKSKPFQAIAATVLLLLAAFFLLKISLDEPAENLFSVYFNTLPDTYSEIIESELASFGAATPTERLEEQLAALDYYETADFKRAIVALETYFKKYPPSDLSGDNELTLYLAISYLAEKESDNAIALLKTLNQKSGFDRQNIASWYLALAYLEQNRAQPAKQLLEQLAKDSSFLWQQKAVELIQKIK